MQKRIMDFYSLFFLCSGCTLCVHTSLKRRRKVVRHKRRENEQFTQLFLFGRLTTIIVMGLLCVFVFLASAFFMETEKKSNMFIYGWAGVFAFSCLDPTNYCSYSFSLKTCYYSLTELVWKSICFVRKCQKGKLPCRELYVFIMWISQIIIC